MRLPPHLLTLILLAAHAPAAQAREHGVSPARARAALAAGQIRPLTFIITEAERRYRGEIIEAELYQDNGRWSYEIEFLPENGKLFVVIFDAANGAVIRTRGPVLEKPASGKP
jgi:uncharacterized membrane protein YkoI